MNYQNQYLTPVVSLALTASLLVITGQARADSFFDQFKDKQDGWFDTSDWVLDNAHGFLPVPIIITEPALGE